ncbi:MAG: ABC transporter ATP-binding protein [Oscillospiraceae bacterium]|nr:ABC transporter ATP-binding protein [Oscillospiraceae bacterium]
MQPIIEVKSLVKRFNAKTVVDNISFAVEKRGLFAFLGQNGAGKTTTINMIIGLLSRDGGEILYEGSPDFAAYKDKIGVVFQNNILDDLLTVEENLQTYGTLYINAAKRAKARIGEIVEMLSLGGVLGQRFNTLSGGQKRKAEIARALIMSPEILFLDEPTTGLDPKTRAEVWGLIHQLKDQNGLTVFLTTHYMEETALADHVAIIDKGRMIAAGSPAELKSQYTYDKLFVTPADAGTFAEQLRELNIEATKTADTYTIRINDTADSIELLYKLKDNIRFYEMLKGSMDDVFLNVVGEKLNNGEAAE